MAPAIPAIRAQLQRMLASATFARAERLGRFLDFVVEETLAGRGATLKESVIASALYSAQTDSDSVVRVDARRLRDKLLDYYNDHPEDVVFVTLPKGSYVPRFNTAEPVAGPSPVAPKRAMGRVLAAVSIVAVALIAGVLFGYRTAPAHFTPVPLTSLPGNEDAATLSPDGNFVTFHWTGPNLGARHIYVKAVGGEALRQLTTGSGESNPAWSPDNQKIAFVRGDHGVYVVSALGGTERLISEAGSYAVWTKDSKALLVREPGPKGPFGIVHVALDTHERRQVTQAPVGSGEWRFAVSPDGQSLAFIRAERSGVGDLFIVPVTGGEPRRVTNWGGSLGGVAWTANGRDLVYTVQEGAGGRLWRIPANISVPGKGSRLAVTEPSATAPFISSPAGGNDSRLVYTSVILDVGLRVVDLTAPSQDGAFDGVQRLADSTRSETPGAWSHDGGRLSFSSDRDGTPGIWICDRDGSNLYKLTQTAGASSWSPDGEWIAFDSAVDGNTDIYVIPARGGQQRRLTTEPSIDGAPHWSRDGRSIYFTSTRAGQTGQIWRMPSTGGVAVPITRQGGFRPRESPDGKFLYYADRLPNSMNAQGRLMRVPAEGGEETAVLDDVGVWKWDATDAGIVFLTSTETISAVNLLRYEDHRVARRGRLPFNPARVAVGWAVSRDGRWLVTSQLDRVAADLMLVDNFR